MGPQNTYHPHKSQLPRTRVWPADWPHSASRRKEGTHPGGLRHQRADKKASEKYGNSLGHKAAGLVPQNLLDPWPAFVLEDAAETRTPEWATSCLGRSRETRAVWLLNVVIDLDHVLVAAKSLDEVGGQLQVRVSQLHLCVGDEL